jgi:hypothetical protein
MNRFLSFLLILLSLNAYSQTFAGLKGAANNTWILNQHISDSGDQLDYKASYAASYGIEGLHMLSDQSGVAFYAGLSNIKQQTQGKIANERYVNQISMKYTDISLLYKYVADGGLYIEVGPQLSLRNEKIEEIIDFGGDMEEVYEAVDQYIADNTIFAVFGLGTYITLNEDLRLGMGVKFGYGLTDLTTELNVNQYDNLASNNNLPNVFPDHPARDNGVSSYTFLAQGEDIDDQTFERNFDYLSTHQAFANFNIGLFYTIRN